MSSLANGIQVLDQGVGYGIVVGIGAIFAFMMLGLAYFQNCFTAYSTKQAEEFSTASRSVKPGVITASIVSSWAWSATLLTSSTFAYSYGICGGMWHGALGSFCILLFSVLAIKIKANAAGAHTFPEIVLSSHGYIAHTTYLFFGLATNLFVGACLVLGASKVVAAMSGVNVYAACFLIPLVVAVYVIAGGLRSTFIADYTHTVILFVAILIFGFNAYKDDGPLGRLDGFYDLLVKAAETMPVAGSKDGSYLTVRSTNGVIFAMDLFIGGVVDVWLDQAYWQRAIASRSETAVKAYIAGGIAWYGIPFAFATSMGLACAALTGSPSFPTYPNPLSAAQNGAGLSAPATAIILLGKSGAGLINQRGVGEDISLYNALAGNVVSVVSCPLLAVILTYIFPWKHTTTDPLAIERNMKIMGRSPGNVGDTTVPSPVRKLQGPTTSGDPETGLSDLKEPEKGNPQLVVEHEPSEIANGAIEFHATDDIMLPSPKAIKGSTRLAAGFCVVFFLIGILLVPFSLYGSGWILMRAGFKGWCIFSFIWVWCSMFVCVFWLFFESRTTIIGIMKGIIRFGK